MQFVNGLNWRPLSQTHAADYVASLACDAAVSTDWRITVNTDTQSTDRQIYPRVLIVDNIRNANYVQIEYSGLAFSIVPYKRNPFVLPKDVGSVDFYTEGGITNLVFSEIELVKESDNQYQSAQDAIMTVPTGTVLLFAGPTAPGGFLPLEPGGSNVSRVVFAALFAQLGTTWGAGDGINTFGLPPSDYFVQGPGVGRGVGTIQAGQAGPHHHNIGNHAHTIGDHTHSGTVPIHVDGIPFASLLDTGIMWTGGTTPITIDPAGAGSTNSAGAGATDDGSGGTETRPKNITMLYCIKI